MDACMISCCKFSNCVLALAEVSLRSESGGLMRLIGMTVSLTGVLSRQIGVPFGVGLPCIESEHTRGR